MKTTEILQEAKADELDGIRARRTRFVVTHLLTFLACLLAAFLIWLVVHYTVIESAAATEACEPVLSAALGDAGFL